MNKDHFYQPADFPTREERRTMWNRIKGHTLAERPFLSIPDRRSFFFGVAAAFLLVLSSLGLFTALQHLADSEQPAEIQFDQAYRSAIRQFEDVLPVVSRAGGNDQARDLLQTRRKQIEMIDAAILELRSDVPKTDLSALKQARLRQLYTLKLQVLLEIIEQGDVEL
jgi:hypothetical protein